jgi:hypothetical protein
MRHRCRFMHYPVMLLVLTLAASAAAQAEQPELSQFLRFVEDDKGGGKLEAAVATYENDAGAKVHLVSAVHIGEAGYYRQLNRLFEDYDAVLYEMVKPAGAPAPRSGAQAGSGVGMIQRFLTVFLELNFQLDAVDYTPEHFVHADLDLETFVRMQQDRGESLLSLMLQSMLNEMARGPRGNEAGLGELMLALQAPDRARQLKLLLARSFEDMDRIVAGMEGPDGSVLLTERNKAAMKVLDETLEKGRRNIGIFYGAAHMADLEARLLQQGFRRVNHEWRVAWDMTQ